MKIIIDELEINYEISGEGKAVIMLHGYSCDYRSLYNATEGVPALKEGYKKIYLDLPGMGKSDSARWIKNADIMLEIVIKFIDKVIPNENFLLAGYSYGGYLARGLVSKLPERVEGLLAICPVIIPENSDRELPDEKIIFKDEEINRRLKTEFFIDFSSALVIQNKNNLERLREEIVYGVKEADREFIKHYRASGYGFSFEIDVEIFDKASLFLMGRQDSVVGYKDAMNILDYYPRASYVVLDCAGHNLQIEQEKQFNLLVSNWVIRVEELI